MIGERIKQVRKDKKMTQQEFCNRIGVKQPSLAAIESGRNNPSDQTIFAICKAFQVSEKWLRSGEGEPYVFTSSEVVAKLCEDYGLDGVSTALLEKFIVLPDKEQKIIIDYLCNVVDAIRSKKTGDEKTEAEKLHAQLDAELNKEKEAAEKSEA